MNRKYRIVILFFLLCCLLSGCFPQRTPSPSALDIATSIVVQCLYQQTQFQCHYTNTDKIDVILHYLHSISPKGRTAVDPELLHGDTCIITVYLTSGNQHIYRLKEACYFSVDYHPWQSIDREDGSILFHLFHHIPSDPSTAHK